MSYLARIIPAIALIGIGVGVAFWWWWLIAPCALMWVDCWMPKHRRAAL